MRRLALTGVCSDDAVVIYNVLTVISAWHEEVHVRPEICSVATSSNVKEGAEIGTWGSSAVTNGSSLITWRSRSSNCCRCSSSKRLLVFIDVGVELNGTSVVVNVVDLRHVGFVNQCIGYLIHTAEFIRNQVLPSKVCLPRPKSSHVVIDSLMEDDDCIGSERVLLELNK